MPRPASAIVIGGGVAGASIARWLSSRGVGVTVLEKAGQLCAGATWHAAGLVTRFGGSPKIKKVHVRALELMTALHDESDGCGLHLTGSIRLIEKGDGDRLLEAKQHLAMARLYDDPALPTTMIGADEIARLHPLVDVSSIECGVFTPRDGDVDPTMLTTAIARVATAHGAQFRFNAEVRDVRVRADGRFDVAVGDDEVLSADAVINCAGLWSRRFSRLLGDSGHPVPHHPALVIEHQYAVTESLPELAGRLGDGERVPVLRDLAGSSYIRQERDGLLVGERAPRQLNLDDEVRLVMHDAGSESVGGEVCARVRWRVGGRRDLEVRFVGLEVDDRAVAGRDAHHRLAPSRPAVEMFFERRGAALRVVDVVHVVGRDELWEGAAIADRIGKTEDVVGKPRHAFASDVEPGHRTLSCVKDAFVAQLKEALLDGLAEEVQHDDQAANAARVVRDANHLRAPAWSREGLFTFTPAVW